MEAKGRRTDGDEGITYETRRFTVPPVVAFLNYQTLREAIHALSKDFFQNCHFHWGFLNISLKSPDESAKL